MKQGGNAVNLNEVRSNVQITYRILVIHPSTVTIFHVNLFKLIKNSVKNNLRRYVLGFFFFFSLLYYGTAINIRDMVQFLAALC